METVNVEAIYERGTLKLPRELPLSEGQKVIVTIHATDSAGQRLFGLIRWKGSQDDLDHLLSPDNIPWTNEE